MAQTRTPYLIIDDDEIDAESPITESLMTRLRDQWYGALADPASAGPASDRVALPERAKDSSVSPIVGQAVVTDGLGGFILGRQGFIGCIGQNNAAQSSGGALILAFPDDKTDPNAFFDGGSQEMTIPAGLGGVYQLTFAGDVWNTPATETFEVQVNGSPITIDGISVYNVPTSAGTKRTWSFDRVYSDGDVVRLILPNGGGTGNCEANARMSFTYIGPV